MGLVPVHLFVGPALGTKLAFDRIDEPEKKTPLLFAGMLARRTFQTAFRQLAVPIRYRSGHVIFSFTRPLIPSRSGINENPVLQTMLGRLSQHGLLFLFGYHYNSLPRHIPSHIPEEANIQYFQHLARVFARPHRFLTGPRCCSWRIRLWTWRGSAEGGVR